jgi:arginase
MREDKEVELIGVPFDMGAGILGARLAPEAVRLKGVIPLLEKLGYMVNSSDLKLENSYENTEVGNMKNLELVKKTRDLLYGKTTDVLSQDKFPLIIGGDHSIVLGSFSAVLDKYSNPGIIYIDAHADINTEETSLSGNIHGMSVAFLMGMGKSLLAKKGNVLKPSNIVYIGLRDLDCAEAKMVEELGVKTYFMSDIQSMGLDMVLKEVVSYISSKADELHVSLDLDVLDPNIAPGTGVQVSGGMSLQEVEKLLTDLSTLKKIISFELVELNPLLDRCGITADIVLRLVEAFFRFR